MPLPGPIIIAGQSIANLFYFILLVMNHILLEIIVISIKCNVHIYCPNLISGYLNVQLQLLLFLGMFFGQLS
jgi:hypothetical protein